MVKYKRATIPLGAKEDNPLVPITSTTRKRPTASLRRQREATAKAQISRQKRMKLLHERTTIEKMVGTEEPSKKVGSGRLEGQKLNENDNMEEESSEDDEDNSSEDEPIKKGGGGGEVSCEGQMLNENDNGEEECSEDDEDESSEDGGEQEESNKKGGCGEDDNGENKNEDINVEEDSTEDESSKDEGGEKTNDNNDEEDSSEDDEESSQDEGEKLNENDDGEEEQVDDPQPASKMTRRKESLPDVRVIAGIKEDGPFPGGPQDNSVLRKFYDHVALKIWLGQILDGDSFIKKEMASKYLQEGLGLDKDVIEEELERNKGDSTIQTEWIKSNFEGKEDLEDDAKVDCAVRAYLMYMIGCALLPDKSGTMMSVAYMRFLLDVTKIHEYAWGVSVLAYLYRQLGFSSRSDVKQLAGYLPLLEVWVYEHFPIAKGLLNTDYVEELPRMRRWNEWPGCGRFLGDRICTLREELDLLTPQEVVWDPYSNLRSSSRPLEEKAFYSGCLCCLQEVEGYYPDRVLRQFGRIQMTPADALKPMYEYRPRTGRNYQLTYSAAHASWWKSWNNHVLNQERRGEPVVDPWDCDNLYLTWFKSHCHPRVQSPEKWKRTCPYSLENDSLERAKEILKTLLLSEGKHCSRTALVGIRDAYNLMCGRDMGIGSNWDLDDVEEESEEQQQPTRRQTRQRTQSENVAKTNRGRGRGRGKTQK